MKQNTIKLAQLLLVLSILITPCHGQTTKEEHSNGSATRQLVTKPTFQSNFKDPLFFIEGQLCQHLRKIFQDSKGNLWFGTNVYDLMLYDGDSLQYITNKDAFSGGRVTGIAEDSSGNLWFSTAFGFNKYDGKSFTTFREENGLPNSEIWSLLIDSKGIFWIGHNKGLSRFDGNEFRNITIPKAHVNETNTIYSPDRITGIAEDKEGNVWLGTDGYGICKYDGTSFTSFTTEDGLADNTIHDLMVDSKGNVWIGTYWGGVSMYDGNKFTNFTKDEVINGVEVCGFYEDREGNIWFAAENNGVYRYDGKSFTNFNESDGLNTNGILSIFEDKEGRFWFGGWGGLFRFDGKSFISVTKDGPWD